MKQNTKIQEKAQALGMGVMLKKSAGGSVSQSAAGDGSKDQAPKPPLRKQFSIISIKKMAIEQSKPQSKVIELQGNSCYLFDEDNKFRNICKSVICHPNFDNLILYLILFSTIMLCIENPLENPLGEKK